MSLDPDALVAAAIAQAGHDDFGPPSWREGFDRLVAAANAEAQLSELGHLVMAGQLTRCLVNRLGVVGHLAAHPAVAAAAVEAPVFILGLPRTGTTLLSYLLDQDPATRSLIRAQAMAPVPPPAPTTWATDPRLAVAAGDNDAVYSVVPEFKAMHHEEPDGPTECVTLLGNDFRSIHFATLAEVPSYDEWLLGADVTSAYEHHRDTLRVLQAEWPGRWMLKSPAHNLHLPAVTAAYPDARFLMTHRDPSVLVASICSLVSTLHRMSSDADHRAAIASRWPEILATMVERPMAWRDAHPSVPIHDIDYPALVADPLGTVAGIYEFLDWPFSAAVEGALRRWMAANPQGRWGRHEYSLDDFGLSVGALAERFTAYCSRHGVPCGT